MVEQLVEQYLSQMTPDQISKSNAYFEGGYWLILWNLLITLAVAWLFIFKGLSARLRDFTQKLFKNSFLQNCTYFAFYTLLTTLLLLPWTVYTQFIREHQYDLSNQTFMEWFLDLGKGLGISFIFGGIIVATLYALVKKLGDKWWIAGSLVMMGFMAFFMMIYPVFVAPLFNEYKPLDEGPLKQSILSMAKANGIETDNVYVYDASKQTKKISANVSGFGSTMRISLNDNLLNRTSPEEIKAVMGHEIGHYALNHVYESLIYFGILFILGFAFVHYSMVWFIARFGSATGIKSIYDIANLPLALAALSLYFFVATPVSNSIIRSNEVEADIYGLNAAREPDGFAKTSLKLSEYRKMRPGYWEEILFYDHPSGENRIRMSMQWKLENPTIESKAIKTL